MQYLSELLGTDKESNRAICPTNKSSRRKTIKLYQNAVWLMPLHSNSFLYVFFSLEEKEEEEKETSLMVSSIWGE